MKLPQRGKGYEAAQAVGRGTADGRNFRRRLEISSLPYDSRTLALGALFVALPEAKTDGSRFIDQALERGAAAVLCEQPPKGPSPWLTTPNARLALALVSANWFGHPGGRR